ncbi:unnamed protein product [Gadus morhua 'NCC']
MHPICQDFLYDGALKRIKRPALQPTSVRAGPDRLHATPRNSDRRQDSLTEVHPEVAPHPSPLPRPPEPTKFLSTVKDPAPFTPPQPPPPPTSPLCHQRPAPSLGPVNRLLPLAVHTPNAYIYPVGRDDEEEEEEAAVQHSFAPRHLVSLLSAHHRHGA